MDSQGSRRAWIFYCFALSMAVVLALMAPWFGESVLILTMITPTVAALTMLLWIAPEGGWRKIPGLLALNRAGLKGWPLALGGPLAIYMIGFAILALTGFVAFVEPTGGSFTAIAPDIVVGLVIGTILALFEEAGWRGYMLPRLAGAGLVRAMLIVGFLHGLWHMPLLLGTDFYHGAGNPWLVVPMFLTTLTLAGIFYGFLRVWTGSVWPVAIAHAAATTGWDLTSKMSKTESVLVQEYIGGESGVIMIGGLVVVAVLLIRTLRRGGFEATFGR
jgi:membrane protease YdiL (CAAX protease family)